MVDNLHTSRQYASLAVEDISPPPRPTQALCHTNRSPSSLPQEQYPAHSLPTVPASPSSTPSLTTLTTLLPTNRTTRATAARETQPHRLAAPAQAALLPPRRVAAVVGPAVAAAGLRFRRVRGRAGIGGGIGGWVLSLLLGDVCHAGLVGWVGGRLGGGVLW